VACCGAPANGIQPASYDQPATTGAAAGQTTAPPPPQEINPK
jgi:hypothetical protein